MRQRGISSTFKKTETTESKNNNASSTNRATTASSSSSLRRRAGSSPTLAATVRVSAGVRGGGKPAAARKATSAEKNEDDDEGDDEEEEEDDEDEEEEEAMSKRKATTSRNYDLASSSSAGSQSGGWWGNDSSSASSAALTSPPPHYHPSTTTQQQPSNYNTTANSYSGSSGPDMLLNNKSSSSSSSSSTDANIITTTASTTADADAIAAAAAMALPAKRWRDWWLRLAMTFVMIGSCIFFVYVTKQPGVIALIFVLQGFIYKELVMIAVVDSKEKDMPGFHVFYWYWFLVCAFFLYVKTTQRYVLSALRGVPVDDVFSGNAQTAGAAFEALFNASSAASGSADSGSNLETTTPNSTDSSSSAWSGGGGSAPSSSLLETSGAAEVVAASTLEAVLTTAAAAAAEPHHYQSVISKTLDAIVTRYEPIAYALYMVGFVAFVISLRQRRNFRYQFSQFAYCHIALLLVVVQSTYLASNIFQGLIWFFLPCGLVVANDSFAYVAGFFFGRTPLIRLSPKKTVEGFVGGAIATIVYAVVATHYLTTIEFADTRYLMACPVVEGIGFTVQRCDVNAQSAHLYEPFPLSQWRVSRLFPESIASAVRVSEMQWHAIALAIFASVVAPFGGFFASGFKRAFKIKDFGTSIPGHGGFTDRMDCQLIMGAFSYIYAAYILNLGRSSGHDLVEHYLNVLRERLGDTDLQALHTELGHYLATISAAARVGE